MAALGFGLLVLSGRSVVFAIAVMLACFVAAMAWSWWRFHTKLQQRDRR